MTLGVAWERRVGGIRELVVASDSRLSGGQFWDANPKIVLLPRTDAVISFAGATHDAYPLMLQAYNAIKMFPRAEDRSMDLSELKGHLIRVFNQSRKYIHHFPRGQSGPDDPEAVFVLSGYSWKKQEFRVWTLHFDRSIARFTFKPTKRWGGQELSAHKLIAFVGDPAPVQEAKSQLVKLLRERKKIDRGSLDMEPFEVLRDIIRAEKHHSVGGPIQVVKIYQHSNVIPVGVYWPDKSAGAVCVLGRPLMEYERLQWGVIDPDRPDRAWPVIGSKSNPDMDS